MLCAPPSAMILARLEFAQNLCDNAVGAFAREVYSEVPRSRHRRFYDACVSGQTPPMLSPNGAVCIQRITHTDRLQTGNALLPKSRDIGVTMLWLHLVQGYPQPHLAPVYIPF